MTFTVLVADDHALFRQGVVATLAAVRLAIGRLPRRQRAAFIQRQLHGLSYREVGAALGCTAAAARANVYQAVRRLRRELAAGGETPAPHPEPS